MNNNTITMTIEKGYDLMSILYNKKKLRYRNRILYSKYIPYTVTLLRI